ncbi:MAG: hypothetical protein UT55_C0040G0003 [Candidatus Peregrinibacteria bacterium GW2011_GWE2_39_6]|nr:MAG: hypothetical protein UT36_C0003G0067 [Candidatus Peregrinibacteria bacterium GW2011_GWF2_39_17]KKR25519.1 MAG: hypothetical protein UT55_C0040G0003 [Candidatus Peregrinibacteria bacterium GW2011_GWE2_39_6]HCW31971.1 hypothetical protein [Candidatus Peregrinibacteria bacterium]
MKKRLLHYTLTSILTIFIFWLGRIIFNSDENFNSLGFWIQLIAFFSAFYSLMRFELLLNHPPNQKNLFSTSSALISVTTLSTFHNFNSLGIKGFLALTILIIFLIIFTIYLFRYEN